MKKLVVMGLAMAMTVSMMNGVCAQPVHAAKGKGLKVALLMSGAANDQVGTRPHMRVLRKPVINTDVNLLIQKIWKLLTFLLLLLIMQAQDMM